MTKEARSFDIRSVPELARLAGQVRASNRPLFLRGAEETVAVLMPVNHPKARRRRDRTEADYEAFRSSAGGWKDNVDVDRLKEGFAESRRMPPRPRPDL